MSSSGNRAASRWRLGLSLLALLVSVTIHAAPTPRIVAIGDVHGAGDAFVSILQKAGLIDGQKRWSGGTAILVQTGDLLDRGPDVRQILDLLISLETQANAAGGRVQALMGNHEVMNLVGETRDVALEVYQQFADSKSEQKREDAFQTASKLNGGSSIDRGEWMAAHPLGYIEYREALAANAAYGKWLRSKPIAAAIGGTIFMHGGINLEFTTDSVDNLNKRVRRELTEFEDGFRWLQQHDLAAPFSTLSEIASAAQNEWVKLDAKRKRDSLTDEDITQAKLLAPILKMDSSALLNANGPLWFRGYSTWTDQEGSQLMPALLKKYKVKRFVTAHTPQPGGHITTRFGSTLYLIDTGMLNGKFYPGGRPSALEINGDAVTQLYVDR
jgi:calcineurin-like phosphoesterase family protein